LLSVAHSLMSRDPRRFSVAALCRETGLSRSRVRRHFPTKNALTTALLSAAPAPERRKRPRNQAVGGEEWVERRLRVCERALSILEAKAEDTAREQSRSISMLEERLPHLAPPVLTSVEPPPFADTPTSAKPQGGEKPEATPSLSPDSVTVVRSAQGLDQDFSARKKLHDILESVRASEKNPDARNPICGGRQALALPRSPQSRSRFWWWARWSAHSTISRVPSKRPQP